jgi:hypothetical protein
VNVCAAAPANKDSPNSTRQGACRSIIALAGQHADATLVRKLKNKKWKRLNWEEEKRGEVAANDFFLRA